MYWSLLPVAGIFFWLALRTPSALLMVVWMFLTLVCLLAWGYLHYRRLFPEQNRELQITPLDSQQLELLRKQRQNGAQQGKPVEAATAPLSAHTTPAPTAAPAPNPTPHPTPTPTPVPTAAPVERPITGRAVFILPDDDLPPPSKHIPPQ
ncbi:hypothetical protein CO610_04065 [Lysobacteraceae bacterium NML95-0200]|nr:hypothetical protein CO610_04065 [Xanthomonadaceae bacterium NML95-0200]